MPFWLIDPVPVGRLANGNLRPGSTVVFADNVGGRNDHLVERLRDNLGAGPYMIVEPDPQTAAVAAQCDHVFVNGKKGREFVPLVFLDAALGSNGDHRPDRTPRRTSAINGDWLTGVRERAQARLAKGREVELPNFLAAKSAAA